VVVSIRLDGTELTGMATLVTPDGQPLDAQKLTPTTQNVDLAGSVSGGRPAACVHIRVDTGSALYRLVWRAAGEGGG
jgi:hypothetical protein